jgi:diguanylate cyclase (GGDEF)-like protein
MQAVSFATVGLLVAEVRDSFLREQGLARTDSLTGLANRKGFYEEAVRLTALCRRSGRPITAGYIDLDNFKAANDELGHEKGDQVLRSAADALLAAVRPSDVAARVGGDEFIVLLPEVDAQEAVAALERIRASLSEALPQEPVHVSASIGGVTFTVAPESIEQEPGWRCTRSVATRRRATPPSGGGRGLRGHLRCDGGLPDPLPPSPHRSVLPDPVRQGALRRFSIPWSESHPPT